LRQRGLDRRLVGLIFADEVYVKACLDGQQESGFMNFAIRRRDSRQKNFDHLQMNFVIHLVRAATYSLYDDVHQSASLDLRPYISRWFCDQWIYNRNHLFTSKEAMLC
jgi:hypothetical protein